MEHRCSLINGLRKSEKWFIVGVIWCDFLDYIVDKLLSDRIIKKTEEEKGDCKWDGKDKRKRQAPFNGSEKRKKPYIYK